MVIKCVPSPQLFNYCCRLSGRLLRSKGALAARRPASPNFSSLQHRRHIAMSTNGAFAGVLDRFEGVTVSSEEEEPCNAADFEAKLEESLRLWTEDGKRGVWFRVRLEQADWIPALAKKGFKFHHARDDLVVMYRWLPKLENCNIPPYAFTLVGVGAVVVNSKNQVLVVSEKHYKRPHWKLPGGYVEPGENIVDAAIREVAEETGVGTEFKSLLSLRHSHHGMFGCSDLYAIVSLKPLTEEIKMCEREIANCRWMDVEEYLSHPLIHSLNRHFLQKHLDYERDGLKVDCEHGIHEVLKTPYTVYHIAKGDS